MTVEPMLESLLQLPADTIVLEDAGGEWSARQLLGAAAEVAGALRVIGIAPGQRLALVVPPSRQAVAVLLGARAAGLLTCPVDFRDPVHALAAIRPDLVVSETPITNHHVVSPSALFHGPGDLNPLATPGDLAWGMATSGSSGTPKIVVLSGASVRFVTAAVQELVHYDSSDRILSALPLYHTYGLSQLWLGFKGGARVLLPPSPLLPGDLVQWAERATVIPGVPSLFRTLAQARRRPTLRLATLAGQATRPEDRVRFAEAFRGTDFLHFYGMTEATTRILWLPADRFLSAPLATGLPLGGTRATLTPEGELITEGPHVASGYLDDPQGSAGRFPSPGRLMTGDLFETEPSGMFRFLGRRDGSFKRMGEKVIPELIEAALERHPAVRRALVTAEPGRTGELEPMAWIVPDGTAPSTGDLLRHLRPLLPPAMLPSRVQFVADLATTSSNKLIRSRPE